MSPVAFLRFSFDFLLPLPEFLEMVACGMFHKIWRSASSAIQQIELLYFSEISKVIL